MLSVDRRGCVFESAYCSLRQEALPSKSSYLAKPSEKTVHLDCGAHRGQEGGQPCFGPLKPKLRSSGGQEACMGACPGRGDPVNQASSQHAAGVGSSVFPVGSSQRG